MKFFKQLFTIILGVYIALGFCFFSVIVFVSMIISSSKEIISNKQDELTKNTILEVDISAISQDYSPEFNLDEIPLGIDKVLGIQELIHLIKKAKTNPNIMGISLPNSFASIGYTQIESIRNALADFKQDTGKFIYAYGDLISQKDYYLKSVADSIFVSPMSIIEFKGLSSEILYLKEIQNKTGVKFEVIRHGKYKSAVEPFLSNSMSEFNREQISSLLNSIWNKVLKDISLSRDILENSLNNVATNFELNNIEIALKKRLIDGILYKDEYETFLKQKLGLEPDEDLNLVSIHKNYSKVKRGLKSSEHASKNKIAVIYAQGQITYSSENDLNGESINYGMMAKALNDALDNEEVKAIVIRINSPGGDAYTSDQIWREIKQAGKEKPVYVSMGRLAASGGYYIACGAEKIFAEEMTITGSIGVFALLPNLSELHAKIGVHPQVVQTHKNAHFYSVNTPINNNTREKIKESIENIYANFSERVSSARNMSILEVEKVAQGRVWSGSQAKEIGLVDDIGGLDKTIVEIAKHPKVNLDEYSVISYPKLEFSYENIIRELSKNIEVGTRLEHTFLTKKLLETLNQVEHTPTPLGKYFMQMPYQLYVN